MFAYLRSHHKRSGSNPTSPDVTSPSQPFSLQSPDFFSHSHLQDPASDTQSPVSPLPPVLPPIPRIASRHGSSSDRANDTITSPTGQEQGIGDSKTAHLGGRGPPIAYKPSGSFQTPTEHTEKMPISSRRSQPTHAVVPTGRRVRGQSMTPIVNKPLLSRPVPIGQSPIESLSASSPALPPHALSTETRRAPPTSAHQPFPYPPHGDAAVISGQLPHPERQPHTAKQPPAAPPTKSAKAKLNMLNPVSLLLRRRSAQVLEHLHEDSLVSHQTTPGLPLRDDFDPSIRGKGVHDFSVPRPRRNFSRPTVPTNAANSQDLSYAQSNQSSRPSTGEGFNSRPHTSDEPLRMERQHTPLFKEHFDDDEDTQAKTSAIRAEALADQKFLARNSVLALENEYFSPVGASRIYVPTGYPSQNQPLPDPEASEAAKESAPLSEQLNEEPDGTTLLSPIAEAHSPTTGPEAQALESKKSVSKTPPKTRSRAASGDIENFRQSLGLPAHLNSRSSRFSFALGGDSVTQEKLLEERHKQKAAAKALTDNHAESEPGIDGEEDMYDDYDGYDDDGFEDDIPMIGDDVDFGYPSDVNTLGGAVDMSTARMALRGNPLTTLGQMPPSLGLLQIDQGMNVSTSSLEEPSIEKKESTSFYMHDGPRLRMDSVDLGDGMYFDDGLIEDPGDEDAERFDESVFDDPSHHLYERKAPHHEHPQDTATENIPKDDTKDEASPKAKIPPRGPGHAFIHRSSEDVTATSTNMAAYHSALAQAANQAAAEGRFTRQDSLGLDPCGLPKYPDSCSEVDEHDLPNLSSRPSLVPDDGRFSNCTADTAFGHKGFGIGAPSSESSPTSAFPTDSWADYELDDYDSALEDDPMIAEANAEALANDDDGVYGQEFGFYASARGGGEAQFFQGGYFGPQGLDTIQRSKSLREPNLTPITERSEYSTRNSYISLRNFMDSQASGAMPSPGLAQLARMSPFGFDEDDLSLEKLMKLRRGAFGGSNSSIKSSPSSPRNSSPVGPSCFARESSPMVESTGRFGWDTNGLVGPSYDDDSYTLDKGALEETTELDDVSDSEEEEDNLPGRPDSPTITAATFHSDHSRDASYSDLPAYESPRHSNAPMSPLASSTISLSTSTAKSTPSSLQPPATPTSPSVRSPTRQSWQSHSRGGSDSVTYVKEPKPDGESGEYRWVLERRRTAESGELELIEREVVAGGRI